MGNYKRVDAGMEKELDRLDADSLFRELSELAKDRIGENIRIGHWIQNSHYMEGAKAKGGCRVMDGVVREIYVEHNDALAGIAALSHEIGHLKTMTEDDLENYSCNWRSVFAYERKASRWALAFLRDRLSEKNLARCERILNIWLSSYYEAYSIPEENRWYLKSREEVLA